MLTKDFFKRVLMVLISSLLQSISILVFIQPASMLPSGFAGLALILSQISTNFNFYISMSVFMLILNIPVALFCVKHISLKFVLLSLLQVFTSSLLLEILPFSAVFDDILLNTVFGGVLTGVSVVLALKAQASTGGMDFIAMYVSNRVGKNIYEYVFIFNILLFITFGALNDFYFAGYSILMNFVLTKTINAKYFRYKQVTLLITTSKTQEILDQYTKFYRHGISVISARGGYSNKELDILHTVVSSEEAEQIARLMKKIDKNVIINTLKTEKFYGGFYRNPIE